MQINKIRLHNFRNFEDCTFNFLSPFTVVIGDNGKGKSSLLQGVRLAAAAFLLGLDEPERYHIQKEDVRRVDLGHRFAPQQNCFFQAWGVVDNINCEWKRTLRREGGRTDTKDAADLVKIAESLNRKVNLEKNESIDLPVLCYFSTARLWVEPKQTIGLKRKGSTIKDGYSKGLDTRSDKISALEWIKSNYYKKLKGKNDEGLLAAVLEAISTCVPNWSKLEWDEDNDDLTGMYQFENGTESVLPLFYLSDGLRTVASIVAEIAYRCAILNDHHGENAVKKSKGIVMIDEIDMHIHPNWQKTVVNDLKKAFPEIQFVVTTHSPFIIQSLNSDELINLDKANDVDPKGLSLEEVAEEIMGVESPYAQENAHEEDVSTRYLKLVKLKVGSAQESADKQKELDELEEKISNPAVRSFLKMQRLKNSTSE